MLPNWLLGKSKSKLQEILGGGGGGGTTYTAGEGIDITNHEISVDPVLLSDIGDMSDAIPTKAGKTQITNPNLLHNPWFTVNQRGQSSYSGAAGYSFDRWKRQQSDLTVSSDSDGCIIIQNNGSGYENFIQPFPPGFISGINGRTLTLSVLFKNGTILSATSENVDLTQDSRYCSIEFDDGTVANVRSTNISSVSLQIAVKGNTTTPAIRALKLEIGEISTLAMDPRPDMALERAKCQRYFQRFTIPVQAVIGIAFVQWAGGMRFILPVKQMRTTPTLTVTSQATKIGYTPAGINDATAIESLSIAHVCGDQIVLQALHTGLTPGTVYAMVNMDSDVMYIDFSADL